MTVDADQDIKDPEAYWDEITGDQPGTDDDTLKGDAAEDTPAKEPDEDVTKDDADAALDDQDAADDEPPSTDDDDPWASAPEHLRKLHEDSLAEKDQLITRERGRAAGQQRRADDLQTRFNDLNARLNDTTPNKGDDDARDDDQPDPLAELEQDYPDVAGPLVKTIKDQNQKLEKLEGQLSSQAERDAEAREKQFLEVHPDGYAVISENADAFNAWLYDAPGAIRDAFAENKEALINPESAAMVVSEFKKSLDTGTDPETDNPNDLQSKRERQLRGAQSHDSKPQGGRRPGPPDPDADPEAYWDHLTKQKAS